jgi:hypothetical protein
MTEEEQLYTLLEGIDFLQDQGHNLKNKQERMWDYNCVIESGFWNAVHCAAQDWETIEYAVSGGLFYYGNPL